ncbi:MULTISPECIES: SiaB family protein kinase [unclassified Ruegeria]|uniref:SiaB family protein kinase n=1 Tax=unclassified Ruegeria TaxID=2625375 RepID=UPI000D6885CD|nr:MULTISPECIES: SiaB family protein kinase [unclassified Ruegeria]
MLASEVYELRANLRRQGVVFAYSGYVTEGILSGVGDALKQKLVSEDADTKTLRSVFAVFVEQMQNIIRYSVERLPADDETEVLDISYGIVTIGNEADGYVVHAGNLILLSDVDNMRKRLSELRAMNREELRAAYKGQLRSETDAVSNSAGIGLIEIARRASKPIEFDFMRIDDQHAFFALKATV